ncbi:MAG: hypothetical protein IPN70_01755 [Candidatus Moraniibacteriota bacterium]|nr:MAG: hypothetical protein IPN70_01755 [Candidatus Moranbacteria bacterium]
MKKETQTQKVLIVLLLSLALLLFILVASLQIKKNEKNSSEEAAYEISPPEMYYENDGN